MAGLPIYFEQRLVGTIDVDKTGAGFTYAPDWITLPRGERPAENKRVRCPWRVSIHAHKDIDRPDRIVLERYPS